MALKNENWSMAFAPHAICKHTNLTTIAEIEASGFESMAVSVPTNFELDFMKNGLLDDVYYSANALQVQQYENLHLWYYTEFDVDIPRSYLHFAGIDTIADIYINGKLEASCDTMFLPTTVYADFKKGKNEVVVHIKPVCIEARNYGGAAAAYMQKYNYPALYIRKANHMFGWDIMPRIVSAGIWKDVTLRPIETNQITEVAITTEAVDPQAHCADLRFFVCADISGDFATEYVVQITGCCGDSTFTLTEKMWHTCINVPLHIENAKLWYPKNYGEANLYTLTVSLIKNGEVLSEYSCKTGIRTVELIRTDVTDNAGSGEFCFQINHQRVFALGTNWVPLDAFHSRDGVRLPQALALLDDVGCNMVRIWGGNVYPDDELYDFCDAHGIMVWQDFMMACGVYPQDLAFAKKIEAEAVYHIKRLRNHPSLVLWAGDNECDEVAAKWNVYSRNPNDNLLTREILRRAVLTHDYTTPYLPSSPYISNAAFHTKAVLPENHLWGPREYFKGSYYQNTFCHFVSETGYQGFPSIASLRRFLKNPEQIYMQSGEPTPEYMVHATSPELSADAPYTYRIGLSYRQVETLFGKAEDSFSDFVKQSQISQAEAKKYFIEKFRIGKWQRTGVLWWNLIDGWPQISDAVVDYYGCKKLAYSYIKRSQAPVCFMFDEPHDSALTLFGVNDLQTDVAVSYTVTNLTDTAVVLQGTATLSANAACAVATLPVESDTQIFYLIEWTIGQQKYKNHYCTNLRNISYGDYLHALQQCGMDEFEGFEETCK